MKQFEVVDNVAFAYTTLIILLDSLLGPFSLELKAHCEAIILLIVLLFCFGQSQVLYPNRHYVPNGEFPLVCTECIV